MGFFDIFKKKKGFDSELEQQKKIIDVIYTQEQEFEKIKKAFYLAKTEIDKAADIPEDKKSGLFEEVKADAFSKLTELYEKVEKLIEQFREQSVAPNFVIKLMQLSKTIGEEMETVKAVSFGNGPAGPSGPAGPQ